MSAPYLSVTAGLPPKVFPLTPGSFIAGRSRDADLPLPNVEISRQHCRFIWDGQTCRIEDMGSARGTLLNGARLEAPAILKPGDKVGIGPATLEFGLGEPPKIEKREAPTQGGQSSMLVKENPADRIEIDGLLT